MAKFYGNIFNRALGSIGGNTFSAAATRRGKVQTARQRVVPTNPNTPAQQNARAAMRFVQKNIQFMGPDSYSPWFENAVSKLPAYQSFLSYLLQNSLFGDVAPSFGISWPPLWTGNLHFPDSYSIADDSSGNFTFSWSTENGQNGSSSDRPVTILMGRTPSILNPPLVYAKYDDGGVRGDGSKQVVIPSPQDEFTGWVAILFFVTSTINLQFDQSSIHTRVIEY